MRAYLRAQYVPGSSTSFNVPPTYLPTYFLDSGDDDDDIDELRGNAETHAKETKGKAIRTNTAANKSALRTHFSSFSNAAAGKAGVRTISYAT